MLLKSVWLRVKEMAEGDKIVAEKLCYSMK